MSPPHPHLLDRPGMRGRPNTADPSGANRLLRRPALSAAMGLALLVLGAGRAVGVDVDVEQGSKACFLLNVDKGDDVSGNFEVITGRNMDNILVVVKSLEKDARPEYFVEEDAEGIFSFEAQHAGLYEMCLHNGHPKLAEDDDIEMALARGEKPALDMKAGQMADLEEDDADDTYAVGGTRTFGFAFRVGGETDSEDLSGEEEPDDAVDALLETVEELMEGLENMVDHQSYMRTREEVHRDMMESANSRVLWWTVTEAVVLCGMAYWQVGYIRQFFETKRTM